MALVLIYLRSQIMSVWTREGRRKVMYWRRMSQWILEGIRRIIGAKETGAAVVQTLARLEDKRWDVDIRNCLFITYRSSISCLLNRAKSPRLPAKPTGVITNARRVWWWVCDKLNRDSRCEESSAVLRRRKCRLGDFTRGKRSWFWSEPNQFNMRLVSVPSSHRILRCTYFSGGWAHLVV